MIGFILFSLIYLFINLGMGDLNSSRYGEVKCGIIARLCLLKDVMFVELDSKDFIS